MKKIVSTDKAPAAIGPYSQAVWAGDLLFCSGQLGIDPSNGQLMPGGLVLETERAIQNIEAILEAEGLSTANVVKTTVFLADMSDFEQFNEVYGRVFGTEPPARSCVAVAALPKGARVEIEVTAAR